MTVEIDPLSTQHFQELDARFRAHAFDLLRRGGTVKMREAVATSPSGPDSAKVTLDKLVASGMAEVQGEDLVGIDGLSIRPTQHRMELDGRELYTWCAADAVGIPAALEEDAQVTTVCPHCQSDITVSVRQGVPEGDKDIVLWLATSGCSHVMSQFCAEVNFFCSSDHLEHWRSAHDAGGGRVLSLDETAELGRQWSAYLATKELTQQ